MTHNVLPPLLQAQKGMSILLPYDPSHYKQEAKQSHKISNKTLLSYLSVYSNPVSCIERGSRIFFLTYSSNVVPSNRDSCRHLPRRAYAKLLGSYIAYLFFNKTELLTSLLLLSYTGLQLCFLNYYISQYFIANEVKTIAWSKNAITSIFMAIENLLKLPVQYFTIKNDLTFRIV